MIDRSFLVDRGLPKATAGHPRRHHGLAPAAWMCTAETSEEAPYRAPRGSILSGPLGNNLDDRPYPSSA